jgi:hypothetical protein
MQHNRLKLSALFLFGLGLAGLQAQETISTTGGNASGSGGSVCYSVGQVVYNTNTGTTGTVTQGVQQPYEISVSSGIEETQGIILSCSAFPNPTTDFLTLKAENYDKENLSYQLYDTDGKLLENKKIEGDETSIDMSSLSPATYFLKVIDNNKEVKIFKIIKN